MGRRPVISIAVGLALIGAPPAAAGDAAWLEQPDAFFELRIRSDDARPCITISGGGAPQRLCVTGTRLQREKAGRTIDVEADVAPIDARTRYARFAPGAAGIPLGPFSWRLEPNGSSRRAVARMAGGPRCFGAAARDPVAPCVNRALKRTITPGVEDALLMPNQVCDPIRGGDVVPCEFGVSRRRARRTVALAGDSHAETWRGALEVVAQERRWRALSVTLPGCPYTTARVSLGNREAETVCRRHQHALRRWFLRHPEVDTVFVSAQVNAQTTTPRDAGYERALRDLVRLGRRVVVLRDPPFMPPTRASCLRSALMRGAPDPGRTCAAPRAEALGYDPLAAVALRMRSRRVRVVDLSEHMCDRRRCFPVVGGALVSKDDSHMTNTFSVTLGPYLLRALKQRLRR